MTVKIKSSELPDSLLDKVRHPNPLEGEDLIIEDESGKVVGIIIQPEAYAFFLKKVAEREGARDSALDEPYAPDAPTLDDLTRETPGD
ncbi:MAG: hypothetical protein LAT63_04155 [Marinobacter sp.]|nr:hypothetical protein [Marinobacter sp.]